MRPSSLLTCSFSLLFGLHSNAATFKEDHATNLEKYITNKQISKQVLPTVNPSGNVTVEIDFYLNQLLALDGTKQTLRIAAYLQVAWYDERRTWNPDDFGGIDVLSIDIADMWYPRPLVYNGIGDNQLITPEQPITVKSLDANRSKCLYAVKRDMEVTCTQNLQKFPNDRQECDVVLVIHDAFRHSTFHMQASEHAIIKNYTFLYTKSNEWDLVNFTQGPVIYQMKMTNLANSWTPIQVYTVFLTFRRIYSYMYYVYTIIIPLLLLTFLQLLVFFIPMESGEKMSLGITILLSFTIFLLIMDNIIPKTKEMPQLTYFITYSMALSSSSLIITGFIMRLYFTDENTPMSNLTMIIFIQGLARAMCIKVPPSLIKRQQKCNNKVEGIDNGRQTETVDDEVNPWKLAALAVERLMVYVGIVVIVGVSCGFLIPPFYYNTS